jgi:2-methylisocitrate lyase-like PEP mutase family enzyme
MLTWREELEASETSSGAEGGSLSWAEWGSWGYSAWGRDLRHVQRNKACVNLRSDIPIIARTDALRARGFDDCITRSKRARNEGADMGIHVSVSTKEQVPQAYRELALWPLCYNSVENGHAPLTSVEEVGAMG